MADSIAAGGLWTRAITRLFGGRDTPSATAPDPEKRASIENPNVPMIAPTILAASGANINTPFGIITPSVALTLSTVYACIRVVAETIASMDLGIYKKVPGGWEEAFDHPLYHLLSCQPNPFMTSYVWRERMINHRLLYGKSVDAIVRNGAGVPMELRPMRPDSVLVGVANDQKVFKYDGDYYPASDFLHVMNVTIDGIDGASTITFARTTISLGLAAEQYGARLFSQGTSGNKWLEIPGSLTDAELKRLRESWSGNYAGITNAHKVPFLENGAKLHDSTINNDDMQFLGTRQFNVPEVCRWFRVPPHKVGDLARATNNNIEHQSIEFVTDTIRPVAVIIEQELEAKLLMPSERGKYRIRFNLDSLMRGDLQSRYASYAIGRQWGWLSADDVRLKENMNALPDGQGKIYLDPLNMVPATAFLPGGSLSAPGKKPAGNKPDPGDDPDGTLGDSNSLRDRIIEAQADVLADSISRMNRKAMEAMKRAANKPGSYSDAATDFYGKHQDTLAQAISPALAAIVRSADAFNRSETAPAVILAHALVVAQGICASQLRALEKSPDQIEPRFTEWASNLNAFARQCAVNLATKLRKSNDKAA